MSEGRKDTILDRYEAVLAFFRVRLSSSDQDAAFDLTQDTLLAALKAVERANPTTIRSVPHFVLGIARHKFQDYLERKGTRAEVPLEEVTADVDARSLERRSQLVRLLEEEQLLLVQSELRHLSPDARRLLELRFGEDLSNEEAARRLGMPAAEASRLKYRAEARLRRRIEDRLGKRLGKPGHGNRQ